MTSFIRIHTDGSCPGNGSPFATGGWAAVIENQTSQLRINGAVTPATSQRMELQAAIEGLKAIENSGAVVTLYTDSAYVRNGCMEWLENWKGNGWLTSATKPVQNADLWQALDEQLQRFSVRVIVVWIKGHSGHPMNELADTLAGMASQGEAVKQRRKAGDVAIGAG